MKRKSILLTLFTLLGAMTFAQRSTTAKEADYSFLDGKKDLSIVFDYEGMTVGKNQTEEDYVAETIAKKNEKKAGTGEEWQKAWENGKLNIYEPAFETMLAKKLGKNGIAVSQGEDAEVTLIVKTTRIEPGFNAGVAKMAAQIDVEYIFVETANKDNILAQIVMSRVVGGDSYAVSDRVVFAYRGAAARLGGYMLKYFKKAGK